MKFLSKAAAFATIVAAVFSVATYLDKDKAKTISKIPSHTTQEAENQQENLTHQSQQELGDKSPKEIDVSESKIRARFKAALKIPGSTTRSSSLEGLAKKSANLGYFKIAFDIALKIPGSSTKSSTLNYVAIKVAKSGDTEFATEVAVKIPGSTTRSSTLQEISRM